MKQFNRILSIFEIAAGVIFIAISVFYFCVGLGCYFSLDSFCRIEGSHYVMWGLLLGAPLVVSCMLLKKSRGWQVVSHLLFIYTFLITFSLDNF